MKKCLILLLILLTVLSSTAQNDSTFVSFKGTLLNSKTNAVIPFGIIGIQEKNDSLENWSFHTADSTGQFQIETDKKGLLLIRFNAVGYLQQDLERNTESLTEENNLRILLDPVDESLDEVTISEEKPFIRTESDKIIYAADVDPDADNSNALEMLRKVPLVSVDGEDNIRLKGKTDFKIFMNGKESVLTKTNASEFLKSLPASSIKEIEVITAPGAKYDAEGTGGIINIVTHQKGIQGYMVKLSAAATTLERYRSSVSLTAALGKFVISGNLSGGYNNPVQNKYISTNENFFNDLMHLNEYDASSDDQWKYLWSNVSMSYEFDTLNLLSGEFQLWQGNFNSESFAQTNIYSIDDELYQAFNRHNNTAYNHGSKSGNIDYQRTSKRKKDEILTLSYKFDYFPSERVTEQLIDSVLNSENEEISLINDQKSNESTFQIDYVYPIVKALEVEIGSKYIIRRNSSNSEGTYFDFDQNSFVNDENETLRFNHNQDIIAGYLSLNGKLKKFGYKAGLRFEHSNTEVLFEESIYTDFSNQSVEYVPSFVLTYDLKKMNSIQLGYSNRIQRPGIWYLNPYVDDTNPKYVRYGNPDLTPEYVHSFYTNFYFFTKIGSVNFGGYYDITVEGIGRVYTLIDEDIIHETYDNNLKKTTYGFNFNANLTLLKKLSVNANITTDYNVMTNPDDETMNNESWGSYSYMSLRYSLPKSFALSAYGGLYSIPAGLQRTSYRFYYSGLSLKKSFLKDKLSLTISGLNVFWKDMEWDYEITDIYFHQRGTNRRPGRDFRISLSYKIGDIQTHVKRARRGIQNTDVKSGGDGDSQGGGN